MTSPSALRKGFNARLRQKASTAVCYKLPLPKCTSTLASLGSRVGCMTGIADRIDEMRTGSSVRLT